MGELVNLSDYKKARDAGKPVIPPSSPEVVAVAMTVEDMRATLYALPNTRSRMEYCFMLIAQLSLWVCKSNELDNPAEKLRLWVARKTEEYTKRTKEG